MLIIQASNIHESAGKILLTELITALNTKLSANAQPTANPSIKVYVDRRFRIFQQLEKSILQHLDITEVKPTMLSRFAAEYELFRASKKNPEAPVFCFGNLPPLFKVSGPVVMYFHTVLYFKRFKHVKPRWQLKLKHSIERNWLTFRLSNVSEILVQSSFVRDTFISEFGFERITILPFASKNMLEPKITEDAGRRDDIDFIYLAAATPHKNHKILFDAWKLLASKGHFPSLHVTIGPRHPDLLLQIQSFNGEYGTKIVNHGLIQHEHAMGLLSCAKAMVFPSVCESLGLPLVEAQRRGVPVVASELDYVRDLLEPAQTFDPTSALSIARAIERFLKIPRAKIKVQTATELSDFLMKIRPS